MEKKGQFYLLAAIVIIALILGYVGVSNYINKKNVTKVYDIKEELNIEGHEVLEFGVLNSKNVELKIEDVKQQSISGEDTIIKHFMTLYTTYLESVGENINLYYVFGNGDKIIAYKIVDANSGKIDLQIGGDKSLTSNIITKSVQELETSSKKVGGGKVTITIDGNSYPFDLKEGENFYFIVSQTIGEDQYVETN